MDNSRNDCPICGGMKYEGVTTFAADLGAGIVVVRHVPAMVCQQCGEEWVSDSVAERLEQVVEDARERKLQVEVADLQG